MADADKTLVSEATLAASRFISSTGMPNGVVSAAPGAIYVDTNKTWDVLAWIKHAGTGNTGWEVLRASSVTRDVTSLSTTPITAGNIRYSRTETGVTLFILGVRPSAAGTVTLFTDGVLSSIAPTNGSTAEFRVGVANTTTTRRAKIDQYGTLSLYAVTTTEDLYGSVHFNTTRPWGALPGTVVTS